MCRMFAGYSNTSEHFQCEKSSKFFCNVCNNEKHTSADKLADVNNILRDCESTM